MHWDDYSVLATHTTH